jgi:hypothetical protein
MKSLYDNLLPNYVKMLSFKLYKNKCEQNQSNFVEWLWLRKVSIFIHTNELYTSGIWERW